MLLLVFTKDYLVKIRLRMAIIGPRVKLLRVYNFGFFLLLFFANNEMNVLNWFPLNWKTNSTESNVYNHTT